MQIVAPPRSFCPCCGLLRQAIKESSFLVPQREVGPRAPESLQIKIYGLPNEFRLGNS